MFRTDGSGVVNQTVNSLESGCPTIGEEVYCFFKNKGDAESCSNYRGIKLISHTMKLWERVM